MLADRSVLDVLDPWAHAPHGLAAHHVRLVTARDEHPVVDVCKLVSHSHLARGQGNVALTESLRQTLGRHGPHAVGGVGSLGSGRGRVHTTRWSCPGRELLGRRIQRELLGVGIQGGLLDAVCAGSTCCWWRGRSGSDGSVVSRLGGESLPDCLRSSHSPAECCWWETCCRPGLKLSGGSYL